MNLVRAIEQQDGTLAWHEPTSQRLFLARNIGARTIVVCLEPADVLSLVMENRGGTEASGSSQLGASSIEMAIVARSDPRIATHTSRERSAFDVLVTSDGVLLSPVVLGAAAGSAGFERPPGTMHQRGSSTDLVIAHQHLDQSNLVLVGLAQVPVIALVKTAWSAEAHLALLALLALLVVFIWSWRFLIKGLLLAKEESWRVGLSGIEARLDSSTSALLQMSDWMARATEGRSISFSVGGREGGFGVPGSATQPGESEFSARWFNRLFFARIGQSDRWLIALIDAQSPYRESMCIFLENLLGEVSKPEHIDEWMAQKIPLLENFFNSLEKANESGGQSKIQDAGLFVWGPQSGVTLSFGNVQVESFDVDCWTYYRMVGPVGSASAKADVGSPLVLWRTVLEQPVPVADDSPSFGIDGPEVDVAQAVDSVQVSEGERGQSSACHWLPTLIVVAALLFGITPFQWMVWDGIVSYAAVPSEAAVSKQGAAASGPAIGFIVESFHGDVRVRLPLRANFEIVKPSMVLPMGTEIILSQESGLVDSLKGALGMGASGAEAAPKIALRHGVHGAIDFSGSGTRVLSESFFASNLGGVRYVESDEIPSQINLKNSASLSPLERVFAFFIPRSDLPTDFPGAARDEVQKRFPIVIKYPERVYLLKTPSLPVVVNLEWIDSKEHTRPYNIYLWSEERSSSAPVKQVSLPSALIQVSHHGRYYWQIEDRQGNFSSASRTLIVSPLDSGIAAAGESDKLNPAKGNLFREIKDIPIDFPVVGAIIYGCPANGDTTIPVRFQHLPEHALRYKISVEPSVAESPVKVEGPARSSIVLSQISLPREGTFSVRVVGYDGDNKVTASSEKIRSTFYPACGVAKAVDFLPRVFGLTTGKALPEMGMMHIMDGAY
jgi:hypothetical protein